MQKVGPSRSLMFQSYLDRLSHTVRNSKPAEQRQIIGAIKLNRIDIDSLETFCEENGLSYEVNNEYFVMYR